MPESNERRAADRLDKLVSDALAGRHLKATHADAADREAIRVAARLAGVRDGYPRMSPACRRRLAGMLQSGEAPGWLNRRAAIAAGFGLAAGAVGGAVAGPLGGMVAARRPAPAATPNQQTGQSASRGIIEPRPELARWWNTGIVLADMAEGVPHRVTAGAVGAFIVRHGNGVVGMSAICTHLPCELVWQADRKSLNCPCHNLAFNINGEPMTESYPLPALPVVQTRVRGDGRVEVLGT
jgi:nitrite reductase/ring-hydroxylating ferredoxin subunit